MSDQVKESYSVLFKELVEATIGFIGTNEEPNNALMNTNDFNDEFSTRKGTWVTSGLLHNVTFLGQKWERLANDKAAHFGVDCFKPFIRDTVIVKRKDFIVLSMSMFSTIILNYSVTELQCYYNVIIILMITMQW